MDTQSFFDSLASRNSPRLGWLEAQGYAPFVVAIMTDRERAALHDWFIDSEDSWPHGNGASGFTAMSSIAGFLLGSGIKNLVQCGHYIGFSTIILGSVFRYMGVRNGLFSMDINEKATKYTLEWVARAGLEPYVRCVVKSSDNPDNVTEATDYFGGAVQSIFIDSSHNYAHTRRELNLWVTAMVKGGLVFLHDVTDLAKSYDSTKMGGVKPAVLEFLDSRQARGVLIDSTPSQPIYRDPCGLGILQKL